MIPGSMLGAVMRRSRVRGIGASAPGGGGGGDGGGVEPGAQWQATHALQINSGTDTDEMYVGDSGLVSLTAGCTLIGRNYADSSWHSTRPLIAACWSNTNKNGFHFSHLTTGGEIVVRTNNSTYCKIAWDNTWIPQDAWFTWALVLVGGGVDSSNFLLYVNGQRATDVVVNNDLPSLPDLTGLPFRFGNDSSDEPYYGRQSMQWLGVYASALSDADAKAVTAGTATDDVRGLITPQPTDLWHIEDTTPAASVPNLINGRGALTAVNTNGDEVVTA